MGNAQTISDMPANVYGMLRDLLVKLENNIITPEQFSLFLKKQNPFAATLFYASSDIQTAILDWQKFYLEVFGLTVDFSQVSIPDNGSTGLNFLQFMAKELTYRMVHNKEKEMYSDIWDYSDDWPEHIDLDFEAKLYPAKSDYAIWHSGNVEADETYKNKTANWIAKKKIKTMTRLQGGNFGLYMLWKHNTIIDQKVVSLWTASRSADGYVPFSCWDSDVRRFLSFWNDPDHSYGILRPRPAVSC